MTESTPGEVQRIFSSSPFIADLGLRLDAAGPGFCNSVLEVQPKHLQQDGFVHAGVQATMADHTAGGAAATLLRQGQIVLTVEFKIHLLRPAKGEKLVCRAKVLRPGSSISTVESEVFAVAGGEEKLVSKLTATMAHVTPRGAASPAT